MVDYQLRRKYPVDYRRIEVELKQLEAEDQERFRQLRDRWVQPQREVRRRKRPGR